MSGINNIEFNEVSQDVLEILQQIGNEYGVPMLVLATAIASIAAINQGNRQYASLADLPDGEDPRGVVQKASANILAGGVGMTTTAIAAANPIFTFPQLAANIGAALPVLTSRFEELDKLANKLRAAKAIQAMAVVAGATTVAAYADGAMDTLPAAGLTALSVAFADPNMREKTIAQIKEVKLSLYRALTIAGGTSLTVGSIASMAGAFLDGDATGVVMSGGFAALNAKFVAEEFKNVQAENVTPEEE
jgi:hypothetical protein